MYKVPLFKSARRSVRHPLSHGLLHGQFFDLIGQAEEVENQRILDHTPGQRRSILGEAFFEIVRSSPDSAV